MMSIPIASSLYQGFVVHRRLQPVEHALRYRVFSLLIDCDELPDLDRRLWLFSYNRFNFFSLYDGDHGDGTSLRSYLQDVAAQSGREVERFLMLCYPRMLGYGFNPVTVYFGMTGDDPKLIVYEVNNTFGERKSYVIPIPENSAAGTVSQSCRKAFHVSPFNTVEGRYNFNLTLPGNEITVGIALKTEQGPVLKAYFRGARSELNDASLIAALVRTGWLSIKVITAIHFEALKLWLKGLRYRKRPPPPEAAITFISLPKEN